MGWSIPRRTAPPLAPDPEPTGTPPGAPEGGGLHELRRAARAAPVVVPRWIQLVLLLIALLALWELARASGPVLVILVVASVVALILNPLVKTLERGALPRPLAIIVVYLGGFMALGGVGVLLSNPISAQIAHFQHDVPHIVHQANRDLADLQKWLDRNGIKIHVQRQGQTALQTLQRNVLKRSSEIIAFSRDLLQQAVEISFALVLILVLSVYLLIYARQIGALVRRVMPPGNGTQADDYPLLVQRAVVGYVRGQLLFSVLMGTSATLALWIFGTSASSPTDVVTRSSSAASTG